MIIYLVNILFLFIWAYIFLTPKERVKLERPEKYFCMAAAMQWILLSGLRGMSVGADTLAYKYLFNNMKYKSWDVLWGNFFGKIFFFKDVKEPGFPLLEKIFQIFTDNYQVWLIFIAIVFTVPMAVWIYKRSSNVFVSFLIYSCLFYSFFAITGIRQTIATGFAVFVGDFLIKKRKFVLYIIMVLLMSTIHRSCLVCIPLYFIYNKKITIPYVSVMLAIMVFTFVFRNQVTLFLADASGYDGYGIQEGAGAYTFTALMIMITIVALWRKKYILEQNPESASCFNALILAMVFVPMTFVDPNTMRIVQYFSVYIMLMIPEILNSFEKREKIIATTVAMFVLIFLFIRINPQYTFFWQ